MREQRPSRHRMLPEQARRKAKLRRKNPRHRSKPKDEQRQTPAPGKVEPGASERDRAGEACAGLKTERPDANISRMRTWPSDIAKRGDAAHSKGFARFEALAMSRSA